MLKFIKEKKGQTLLEVVVTVGVALVIIGSLVTLMNASNRRSNVARQANQASKLAQEGIEIVRHIRDRNTAVVEVGSRSPTSSCTNTTKCSFNELYGYNQTDPTPACFPITLDQLLPPGNQCEYATTPLLDIFTREIQISDGNGGAACADDAVLDWSASKQVTVVVSWESPSGHQTRTATTCLTTWQD